MEFDFAGVGATVTVAFAFRANRSRKESSKDAVIDFNGVHSHSLGKQPRKVQVKSRTRFPLLLLPRRQSDDFEVELGKDRATDGRPLSG